MPYLNLAHQKIALEIREIGTSVKEIQEVTLALGRADWDEMFALVSEVLGSEGGELRVDLPQNWILFWKARESESRILIAHPQEKEWVTTVALDPEHSAALLVKAGAVSAGTRIRVGALGSLGPISNAELILVLN